MAADASAYAALGLKPGADAAAVERAYKRLIKQYHPDRAGGDASRAAEINRAYRELRRRLEPLELHQDSDSRSARDHRLRATLGIAGAIVVLAIVAGPLSELVKGGSAAPPPGVTSERGTARARPRDAMEQRIATEEIDEAIRDAVRISRTEDEVALAEASRDCHRRLRSQSEIALLDRCAGFDNAVVQLQDRDPLRDRGPFSELAVTGRQMSGATRFSNDYLAIDSRLRRIRLYVELALAPPPSPQEGAAD